MIEQFETMSKQRMDLKQQKEKEVTNRESYRSVFPERPNNKTVSVL